MAIGVRPARVSAVIRATDGRGWAYASAALGLALSEAANVAHTFVPPAGASMAWRPSAGPVIGSAVWPALVYLVIEMLARVPWPALRPGGRWDTAAIVPAVIRWGGSGLVGSVAAIVSYRHMSALLSAWGEDQVVATLGPLAIDGFMVMATAALLVTRPAPDPDPTAESSESTDPTLTRLLQDIAAEVLPARPTAEAIRRHLGVGAKRARALRDLLRQPDPTAAVESQS